MLVAGFPTASIFHTEHVLEARGNQQLPWEFLSTFADRHFFLENPRRVTQKIQLHSLKPTVKTPENRQSQKETIVFQPSMATFLVPKTS